MYSQEFVLCLSPPLSLYSDGAVSLSSLVRMANEIGLAGLHRAKARCLVSLGETAVALPSERKASMEREEEEGCRVEEGKEGVLGGREMGDGGLMVAGETPGSSAKSLFIALSFVI